MEQRYERIVKYSENSSTIFSLNRGLVKTPSRAVEVFCAKMSEEPISFYNNYLLNQTFLITDLGDINPFSKLTQIKT